MRTIIVLLYTALTLSAAAAVARADATVEVAPIILVPASCYVGPRTTATIERLCGGHHACYATKLTDVCMTKVEVSK